jgi:hypothetical protein
MHVPYAITGHSGRRSQPGDYEDPDAEYALLRGHVRLKDIPGDLLGNDNEVERIA